ncbi:MAG: hypothetical protein IT373_18820 [Polyangiaceae bacterium]|nr:hypothetical protein [Polyangiaceae bacterium]
MASAEVGVLLLRTPSGTNVIDNFVIPGHSSLFAGISACAAADPLSDLPGAYPTQEGMWALRLESDVSVESARTHVYARRTNDGAFHGGVLDFHVYVSPGSGQSQAYLAGVLTAAFTSYFEPLGITQGAVNFGPLSSDYDTVSSYAEYRELLASSPTWASAPAINLFVVGGFAGDIVGIGQVLGMAPSIPASPMRHGTSLSGLALAPTGDVALDAAIITHEIGHIAGLFHTSEGESGEHDPLGDTPECQTVDSDPTSCADFTNMMFPLAFPGTPLAFSPSQITVLRGSAFYRGILEEGGEPSPPGLPVHSPPERPVEPTYLLPTSPAPRGVETALERALRAHWCARSDVEAWTAARLRTAEDRRALRAIAFDTGALDLARARALGVLVRLAGRERERDEVASWAAELLRQPGSGRRVRVTAIRALRALRPSALSGLGEAELGPDPVVRELNGTDR